MRENFVTQILLTVFWWGLFGIFVETFWTMLRKFKRKILRTEPVAPGYRLFRQSLYRHVKVPLRRTLVKHAPRLAFKLGCEVRKRTPSGKRPAVVTPSSSQSPSPFSLLTVTNGWTFMMFGTGMPLLLYVGDKLSTVHAPCLGRFAVYAFGFWGAEIVWGTLIKMLGSRVPWDYSASKHSACGGLIRKDYFVPWGLLGLLVENFFSYWIDRVIVPAMLAGVPHTPKLLPPLW